MEVGGIGMKIHMGIGIILWIGAAALTGCGYQLVGSSQLPQGIVSIFVAEPVNRTSEFQLISIVSNELKSELTRRQVQMANSRQTADGILESDIRFLSDATVARRGATTALEKRIMIKLDLKLEKADGQLIWQGKGVGADETYMVINGDDLATTSNRQNAISTLARRLAEDVYNRMSADF